MEKTEQLWILIKFSILKLFFFRSSVGKKEMEKSKGNVKFLRCEF